METHPKPCSAEFSRGFVQFDDADVVGDGGAVTRRRQRYRQVHTSVVLLSYDT